MNLTQLHSTAFALKPSPTSAQPTRAAQGAQLAEEPGQGWMCMGQYISGTAKHSHRSGRRFDRRSYLRQPGTPPRGCTLVLLPGVTDHKRPHHVGALCIILQTVRVHFELIHFYSLSPPRIGTHSACHVFRTCEVRQATRRFSNVEVMNSAGPR